LAKAATGAMKGWMVFWMAVIWPWTKSNTAGVRSVAVRVTIILSWLTAATAPWIAAARLLICAWVRPEAAAVISPAESRVEARIVAMEF
jgi:hypothetical protein